MRFQKVLGKQNPADLFIEYLDQQPSGHVETMRYTFGQGRAKEAPNSAYVEELCGRVPNKRQSS